ncbi:hypothetical protein JCM10213v2_003425 [Rhodosporidiobolus nylandii]
MERAGRTGQRGRRATRDGRGGAAGDSASAQQDEEGTGDEGQQAHKMASEVESSLSPWTGVGSPSSSDFEAISDSEVRVLNDPRPPTFPSNLARSLSQHRTHGRDESQRSIAAVEPPRERGRRGSREDEEDVHRRGIEGDDEDSSAFEDGQDEGRGRGRTRRRDPELKRSMLEDALRSSLATLLSLAPVQASMSQTPSLSHTSLSSLFSSSFQPASAPSTSSTSAPLRPPPPQRARTSLFASSLHDSLDEEEDYDDAAAPSSAGEEVFLASSSSCDEDGTQLGLSGRPGAIPITLTSSSRAVHQSYSDSTSALFPAGGESTSSGYSPLIASRPLGAPSSDSPPAYSRRRGTARRRGRGRGASNSPGPGPASVEERRRARAAASAARGRETEPEMQEGREGRVERDEAFAELLSAARFFSELSPRSSRTLPHSLSTVRAPGHASPRPSIPQPLFASTQSAATPWPATADATDEEGATGGEESDPALASESVPTIEGLSSGPDSSKGERSPSPSAGEKEKEEEAEKKTNEPKKGGFFGWLRGLAGAVVELKVWHLVGIAGVLVGVGLGAGTLLRSLVSSAPLLDLLNSPSSSSAARPLSRVPPRLARFGTVSTAAAVGEGEKMSSLFL